MGCCDPHYDRTAIFSAVSSRFVKLYAAGNIVSDEAYGSFAAAEPAYRIAAALRAEGCEVSLHHGARLIFKPQG
jgi:hypothetical protein